MCIITPSVTNQGVKALIFNCYSKRKYSFLLTTHFKNIKINKYLNYQQMKGKNLQEGLPTNRTFKALNSKVTLNDN